MNKHDIHNRSYGYIDEERAPPEDPKKKNKGGSGKTSKKTPPSETWKHLLLFPFRLMWWIMIFLWKVTTLPFGGKKEKGDKKGKGSAIKSILWGLTKLGLVGGVLGFIFLVILTAWVSKDLPDPDRLTDRNVALSTKIYDRTGEHLLYEFFADENRTAVNIEQVPDHLKHGVIATEDKLFYEHHGVRPLSMARAVFNGVFRKQRIGGTSTLTQQLVKNAILTNERTITRKFKEVILSVQLERKYEKDQILQIYFNEIPYGSTNYGVESAAQNYFGKHVWELDLQESATLAGLPKAPSFYLRDKDSLKQRRNFVLKRMHDEGYITQEEKEGAQAHDLTLERSFSDIRAPHFVMWLREYLVSTHGLDEKTIDSGGLTVITSLDWEMQQKAEKVIDEVGGNVLEGAGANNTALVAMDPKNAQILTMVGSKDFFDEDIDGQFNVATIGKRQPGSSFKPIIYAAAFEKGYTPNTILYDVVTNFGPPPAAKYMPLNYSLQAYGPVTMRKALQGSLNIAAVKTLYLVGVENGIDFAKRLGYTSFDEGYFGLALVLGGGEVHLIEHVNAFGTLANGGAKHDIVGVLKIEDSRGDIMFEWKQTGGDQVLDRGIATTISNVLSDDAARAYAFGSGSLLTLPGRPVAAKTGTTNNYVDAWTVGYTPSLVTGVWAGNTNNTPMKRGYGGSKVAAPIWNAFMQEALRDTPVESFPAPPSLNSGKAVLDGSRIGMVTLKVDKVTGKLATEATPEKYIVERTYLNPHSILHYVNREDPAGAPPTNPAGDPHYNNWEGAVSSWMKEYKEKNPDLEISFEAPPTEYDDVHTLEMLPSLMVVYPTNGTVLTTRQIDTDIRVTSPRGVAKVSYQIDGRYIGVIYAHPFNLNHNAVDLDPGEHTISIIVEDDVGNVISEDVTFTLEASQVPPKVSWTTGGKNASQAEFPLTLFLAHTKLDQIASVSISATKESGLAEHVTTVSDFSTLFNDKIPVTWPTTPEPGTYTLIPTITTIDGIAHTGGGLIVTVTE